MADATTPPYPTTIQHLATAVYPSFAMLAGMQLDVFTPLKDGSRTAAQLGLQALLKVNLRLATTGYLSNGYNGPNPA